MLSDFDGLFLLINPSGSKLWRMKYRVHGKEKLLSIPCQYVRRRGHVSAKS